jgi:hypothetical protein
MAYLIANLPTRLGVRTGESSHSSTSGANVTLRAAETDALEGTLVGRTKSQLGGEGGTSNKLPDTEAGERSRETARALRIGFSGDTVRSIISTSGACGYQSAWSVFGFE